jgi:hypothetical protein
MEPKPSGAPLTFGDIVEADWLYDAYLREYSEAVTAEMNSDRMVLRYKPDKVVRERKVGSDYAVAFASSEDVFPNEDGDEGGPEHVVAFGNRRLAIVLTDECETNKVVARGGRLLLATLVPWPKNEPELRALTSSSGSSWRRFPLAPAGPWPGPPHVDAWKGGVVDFSKHVAVWHEAMPKAKTLFSLDEEEAAVLKVAWAAYATRHGPLAAADGVKKLVEMIHIGDDTAKWSVDRRTLAFTAHEEDARHKMVEALEIAWTIEGPLLDAISLAHEARRGGPDETALMLQELGRLRDAAEAAEEALRRIC